MSDGGVGDRVELLDTGPPPARHGSIRGPDPPRGSSAVGVVVALVIAGLLVVVLWSTDPGEVEPRPVPSVPVPPTPEPADPWANDPDLLVALVGSRLVRITPSTGATLDLGAPSGVVAVAGGRRALLTLDEAGEVVATDLASLERSTVATRVTWFIPSAVSGRVWIRRDADPAALVEIDALGTVHDRIERSDDPTSDPRLGSGDDRLPGDVAPGSGLDLEGRRLLATTPSIVFAESCIAERCRIEQHALTDDAGFSGWQQITARPWTLQDVRASADGRWLAVGDDVVGLYRVDVAYDQKVYGNVSAAAFALDSSRLYVLAGGRLEVSDLDGVNSRSVPLLVAIDPPRDLVVVGGVVGAGSPVSGRDG